MEVPLSECHRMRVIRMHQCVGTTSELNESVEEAEAEELKGDEIICDKKASLAASTEVKFEES